MPIAAQINGQLYTIDEYKPAQGITWHLAITGTGKPLLAGCKYAQPDIA